MPTSPQLPAPQSPPQPLPPVPIAYRFAAAIVKPFLTLAAKRTWLGRENLPASGGFIAAVNHISGVDPLFVAHYLYNAKRPPKIMAKASLWKVPVLGAILRHTDQIAVFRNSAQAAHALVDGERAIERGECIMIYPEGTITKDPLLWPMEGHTGAARLAMSTGCPVIPVASWGPQTVLPHGAHIPHVFPRKRVTVVAGPPVDLSDLAQAPDAKAAAIEGTTRILDAITGLVAAQRGEDPPAVRWNSKIPGGGRA